MRASKLGIYRLWVAGLVLIALLALTGAQCTVAGSSGSTDTNANAGVVVVVTSGSFSGPRTRGLRFIAGSRRGFTSSTGGFQFDPGVRIRFKVGDIELGRGVAARERLSMLDLVDDGTLDNPQVINLTRLLMSLDSAPEDDSIVTIPRRVDELASLDNPEVTALLESLDFADDNSFDSVAANLIAVLTEFYPFTAALVDADSAKARLKAELGS